MLRKDSCRCEGEKFKKFRHNSYKYLIHQEYGWFARDSPRNLAQDTGSRRKKPFFC